MSVDVRPATADEVRPLRLRVLRPTAPLVPADYDLDPRTRHFAAFDGTEVVGCLTLFPHPYGDESQAWRLRGMAVDPAYQGQGVGRLVLEAGTAAAAAAGVPLIWANGRVTALPFYERLGWQPVGEVFESGPQRLPHRVILRSIG